MKKRSEEILQSLLANPSQKLTIIQFKKKYKIGERTIRNDISEINDFLRKLHISDLYFDAEGKLNYGPDFDVKKISAHLSQMSVYDYKLSKEERQIYIIVHLLWEKRIITMQSFADDLMVSRITILNDIEKVKDVFQNTEDVQLISDPGRGVFVQCSDLTRLDMLVRYFHEIQFQFVKNGFYQNMIAESLQIEYPFSVILAHVQDYLEINNLMFGDDSLYDLVLCLYVLYNRPKSEVESININITLNEIDNIMMYVGYKINCVVQMQMLVLFRNFRKKHAIESYVRSLDQIELYEVITHFLTKIDQQLQTSLSQDPKLIDSLFMHIKNIRNWGDLDVDIPDVQQYIPEYQMIEQAVSAHIPIVEKYLGYTMTENMLHSIMIHICVSLLRSRNRSRAPSVIVVCPGSMATGRYVEAQIRNYFDLNVIQVLPVKELDHMDESRVDCIISTVQLPKLSVPVIQVHPVLDMEDMNHIQSQLFTLQKQPLLKKQNVVDRLQDELPADLVQQINELIQSYKKSGKKEKSAIGQLLERDCLQIDDEDHTWQDGIRKAAQPMIHKQMITAEFAEQAIANVEEYGDYIILGQGVALAHASKQSGVIRDGLGLLVNHPGIVFSDHQTRVNFLFCFASRGVNEYIELFNEIVKIGQDPSLRLRLLAMDEQTLFETLCYKFSS
ncbi:MAG: BglG family transcription antiterminator [Catenisphaera adipataccumulans]|uniref:BglG family transcription antiterminator n=1 Tax=Catenisphaera adipataccumulans TaxID=700500 RepID=UPI003D935246